MCRVKNKLLDYDTVAFKIEEGSLNKNNYPFIKRIIFANNDKVIFISTMGQIINVKFGNYIIKTSIEGKVSVINKKDFEDKFVIL